MIWTTHTCEPLKTILFFRTRLVYVTSVLKLVKYWKNILNVFQSNSMALYSSKSPLQDRFEKNFGEMVNWFQESIELKLLDILVPSFETDSGKSYTIYVTSNRKSLMVTNRYITFEELDVICYIGHFLLAIYVSFIYWTIRSHFSSFVI